MHHKESAAVLGVSLHATELQIRRAYHSLVKKYHPDVNTNGSGYQVSRLTDAYRNLINYSRLQQKRKDQIYVHGNILLKDPDPQRRQRAAAVLAGLGKRGSYGYLKFALGDSDSTVVKTCIRGISALGLSQGGRELLSLYGRSKKDIKHEILSIVPGCAAQNEYREILYTAMSDSDPFLKQEAYRIFKVIRKQSGEVWEK